MKKIEDAHNFLVVSYAGYNTDVDREIIKIVGSKYESGSGCGFGYRDLDFVFKRNSTLRKAVDRLLERKGTLPKGYRRLKIETYDNHDDENEE